MASTAAGAVGLDDPSRKLRPRRGALSDISNKAGNLIKVCTSFSSFPFPCLLANFCPLQNGHAPMSANFDGLGDLHTAINASCAILFFGTAVNPR